MGELAIVVRRLGAFGALPLLSILTPLVALPILARSADIDQWAALGIGQSLGGLGGLVVGFGWNVIGPTEVANSTPEQRHELFRESLASRLIVAVVAVPLVSLLAGLLPGTRAHGLAALVAFCAATTGLSLGWYAVGVGRAGLIAGYELIPRAVGNLLGAVVASQLDRLAAYPVVLVLFQVVPVAVFWRRQVGTGSGRMTLARVVRRLRSNLSAASTEVVAGAYSLGAVSIVAASGTTTAVATFNSGERLTRFASLGISTTANALQGWVSESSGSSFVRRIRVTFLLHLAVGLAGLVVIGGFAQELTRLLFGPELQTSRATGRFLGVFFLLWSLETVTGRHVLATRRRTDVLFVSTAIGSVVGVAAVATGASTAGAPGAAAGLAFSLFLIVLIQGYWAIRLVRIEQSSD